MANSNLSAAISEAYASAPSDTAILNTLEIYHPDFTAPIRVVRDNADLTATLEATAPNDPSAEVLFTACPFKFTMASADGQSSPAMTIEIDNTGRTLMDAIESITESLEPMRVIYRPYLSTDLSMPQFDPPLRLIFDGLKADISKVSGKAHFCNLANITFPRKTYNVSDFPDIVR